MYLHGLAIVTSLITIVQATCYTPKTGEYGQSMSGADAKVDESCKFDLADYFTEGQTKYRCHQLPHNKVEFWVGWRGRGGWTLDSEDCKQRLKNEIYGCPFGGESVIADWYFR